jgi:hypothetical protein
MTKLDRTLSRRHVLMGASAAAALGTFGSPGAGLATAPMRPAGAVFLSVQGRRF